MNEEKIESELNECETLLEDLNIQDVENVELPAEENVELPAEEIENLETFSLEEDQFLYLPDHIFFHIFNYVDFYSKTNYVGLVCKRFYELLCYLQKPPLSLSYELVRLSFALNLNIS